MQKNQTSSAINYTCNEDDNKGDDDKAQTLRLINAACFQCKSISDLCTCSSGRVLVRPTTGMYFPEGMIVSDSSVYGPFGTLTIEISQTAHRYQPQMVFYVIDNSYSMIGSWSHVIDAAKELVAECPPGTTFTIIAFSDKAEVVVPSVRFEDSNPESNERKLTIQCIDLLRCSGSGTNFLSAYKKVEEQYDEILSALNAKFEDISGDVPTTVVLVTDGRANATEDLPEGESFRFKPHVEVVGLSLGDYVDKHAIQRYIGGESTRGCNLFEYLSKPGRLLSDVLVELTTTVKDRLGLPSVRIEVRGLSHLIEARISGAGSNTKFVIGRKVRKETILLESKTWSIENNSSKPDWSEFIGNANLVVTDINTNQEVASFALDANIPMGIDTVFLYRRMQCLEMELTNDKRKLHAVPGTKIGIIEGKKIWNAEQAVEEYMELARKFNCNYALRQLQLDEFKEELIKAASLQVALTPRDFGQKMNYRKRRKSGV